MNISPFAAIMGLPWWKSGRQGEQPFTEAEVMRPLKVTPGQWNSVTTGASRSPNKAEGTSSVSMLNGVPKLVQYQVISMICLI